MKSRVNLAVRPRGSHSNDLVNLKAHRATISAKRLFEFAEATSLQNVCGAIQTIFKSENYDHLIIEENLTPFFNQEGKKPKQFNEIDYIAPGERVLLVYRDAVAGFEAIAALRNSGVMVDSWHEISERIQECIPNHAWTLVEKNIYPIFYPKPKIAEDLDILLIDCPSRNLSMMPNGLGYVSNAIKKSGVKLQVYDLDVVAYHRYHVDRLYNNGGQQCLRDGTLLPKDPWQAEHYDVWAEEELVNFMLPFLSDLVEEVIVAKPKILGLSIQQCNTEISKRIVQIIKSNAPEIKILVGGFSCYNADIGFKAFPLADYMCIGEADLTVGALVKKLSSGEDVKDMPGVLSKNDTPGRRFLPAPMENNLDKLDDPRYEWFPLSVYRNWDGYQLTPIIASRGCRWSRCTFCAERFYWRIRDPKKFVDEIEYLVSQGCHLFMFNESDLNGDPKIVMDICDEIVRRNLKVKLTAQLRIHKKSDRIFFEKLAAAGFVALRFGVDAFSENTLKLQKKGYTKDTIRQNLRDCWECGIYTEVNWVIGVPGETDADCEEGVNFILENQKYIGRVANINPLILVNGSVYWIDPESHNIHFHGDREEIFQRNDRYVPSSQWYSTEPYIDAAVRKARFENIVVNLIDGGFDLGPWAIKIYQEVNSKRDKSRA